MVDLGTERDYDWATSIDFLPSPNGPNPDDSTPKSSTIGRIESYEWIEEEEEENC